VEQDVFLKRFDGIFIIARLIAVQRHYFAVSGVV
jgi:hypothetical protein